MSNIKEGYYEWWHEYDKNGWLSVEENSDGTFRIEKSLDFQQENFKITARDLSFNDNGEDSMLSFTDVATNKRYIFQIKDYDEFTKAEPGKYVTSSKNCSTYVLKQNKNNGIYTVMKDGKIVATGDVAERRGKNCLYVSMNGVQKLRTSPIALNGFTPLKNYSIFSFLGKGKSHISGTQKNRDKSRKKQSI